MGYMLIGLFFLVKHKTAYEMRISDRSSDVCSSDLLAMLLDVFGNAEKYKKALKEFGEREAAAKKAEGAAKAALDKIEDLRVVVAEDRKALDVLAADVEASESGLGARETNVARQAAEMAVRARQMASRMRDRKSAVWGRKG